MEKLFSESKIHVIYNIAGSLLPLLLALATIPLYLSILGAERYGIIALVWLLFGYFGLFDLGLSKATANHMAQASNQTPERQSELFWIAFLVNSGLGLLGAIAFLVLAPPILKSIGAVSSEFDTEFRRAIPWIAVLVPLSTISSVVTGALESRKRFLEVNFFGILGASLTQLIPLIAISYISPRIDTVLTVSAIVRLASVLPVAVLAIRMVGRPVKLLFRWATVVALFSYGGWITVSNLISPLLVSVDQFVIASVLGAAAVAAYAIPFNLAMKVLVLPSAIVRALFPDFSRGAGIQPKLHAERVAGGVAISLAIICIMLIVSTDVVLSIWLGSAFAAGSSATMKIILVGVWVNGVALLPYTYLQSQGRPDIPAKFHALEILPFIVILWICIKYYGLEGAAVAWDIRIIADAFLMIIASKFSRIFIIKFIGILTAVSVTCALSLSFKLF